MEEKYNEQYVMKIYREGGTHFHRCRINPKLYNNLYDEFIYYTGITDALLNIISLCNSEGKHNYEDVVYSDEYINTLNHNKYLEILEKFKYINELDQNLINDFNKTKL